MSASVGYSRSLAHILLIYFLFNSLPLSFFPTGASCQRSSLKSNSRVPPFSLTLVYAIKKNIFKLLLLKKKMFTCNGMSRKKNKPQLLVTLRFSFDFDWPADLNVLLFIFSAHARTVAYRMDFTACP